MTEKENILYSQNSRYSAERMVDLLLSLQKVEGQINAEYIRRRNELENNGVGVIPTFREMLGNDNITLVVDIGLLDYIDNLNYIKQIYDMSFQGKDVTLKVGIEER